MSTCCQKKNFNIFISFVRASRGKHPVHFYGDQVKPAPVVCGERVGGGGVHVIRDQPLESGSAQSISLPVLRSNIVLLKPLFDLFVIKSWSDPLGKMWVRIQP